MKSDEEILKQIEVTNHDAFVTGLSQEEWKRFVALAKFGISKLKKVTFHIGESSFNNYPDERY